MSQLSDIKDIAAQCGLILTTWSPGDGATRYRYHLHPRGSAPTPDYFSDDGVYTAVGLREAVVFLKGVNVGRKTVAEDMKRGVV